MADKHVTSDPWRALIPLCGGIFITISDTTALPVLVPTLMSHFDVGIGAAIWASSAALLSFVSVLLLAGRLGDNFGQRRIFVLGLSVFMLGALFSGMAPTVGTLIATRAFQGVGVGLLVPQTMAVVARTFPAERRGRALAVWGAVAGAASLAGPIVGGVVTAQIGWRWVFWMQVPLAAFALALAVRWMPRLQTHPGKVDTWGAVLSTTAIMMVVVGLMQQATWSAWSWALVAGGLAFSAVFAWWQHRQGAAALVPLDLFHDRDFVWASVSIAGLGAVVATIPIPLMLFLQEVEGVSPGSAGLFMAPMALTAALLAPVAGWGIDTFGPKALAPLALLILGGGTWWLSLQMRPGSPDSGFVWPVLVAGAAIAVAFPALSSAATHGLPAHLAGAGSGAYNCIRQLGAVLGTAGVAAVLHARLGSDATNLDDTAAGIAQSMVVPTVISVLAAVASLGLRRRAARAAGGQPLDVRGA